MTMDQTPPSEAETLIVRDNWPLKRKYLGPAHRSTFKGGRSDNKGRKKLLRSDLALVPKSNIHQPKKAKWPKHMSGSWWGGKAKG